VTAYVCPIRVELRHEFFADALARDVTLVPEPDTAVRMRQPGWYVRTQGPVLTIMRPDPDPHAPAEDVALLFQIFAMDVAFTTYTDLPGWQPSRPWVFDCAAASPEDKNGSRALSRDEPVGAPGADSDAGSITPAHGSGALIALLVLRIAGDERDRTSPVRSFHLLFHARRVHWKYLVLGAPQGASPTIHDPDGPCVFEPAGMAQGPDGREAVALRSTEPIPFRERAPQRFQLRLQTSAGERVVISRLATASTSHMSWDTVSRRKRRRRCVWVTGGLCSRTTRGCPCS
jgi:hypothetical protein